MSYGFKIIGSDAGGTFTVSDTELDILNLIVTDAGRAHSFTLPGGLLESDMIFVKNPSAPGGGDWSSVDIEVPSDYLMTVTFDTPYLHKMNVSGETVTFTGTGIEAYTPQQDGEFQGWKLEVYNDWQTEFDYFVVRKASTIMADPSRYDTSMDYGIRVVTSNNEVSFDSRALGTNYNFDIVSYLPPLLSNNVGTESNSYVMTKDADEYVNIEWSAYNTHNSDFFGLRVGSTLASAYDAIVSNQNGDERIRAYPTGSLIGATLRLGGSGGTAPPDDDGDVDTDSDGIGNPNATGSLSYQSGSAITEGSSITFNANTSEEGAYHVRVFQTSGSGNDLGSDRVSFFGDTKSATFTTTSPTSSRSVSYTNVANYIGAYSRNSVASYSRTVAGTFSRNFAGNYVGEYTGDYSGAYSRTSTRTYGRTRVENYARSFSAVYSRTRTSAYVGIYSRTDTTFYSRDFSAVYVGNFTRNSTLSGPESYSRNLLDGDVAFFTRGPSTVTYSRTRYSTYTRGRQSTRTSSYVRSYGASYIGNYSRNYTRSRISAYTRDRTVTYSGYYSRGFTRNSVLSGTEGYSRQIEIEPGEFEELFFTRTPAATNYSRTRYSVFTRTRGITRNEYYSRTFVATFTGDFVGNYGRTRVTNFVGDYARTTSASYVGEYSRNYTRVGSYARNYLGNYVNPAVEFTRTSTRTRYSAYSRTRTKVSSYFRDFVGNYIPDASTRTLYYLGNYSRGFARNFTRTSAYEGTYVGNYAGDFAAAGSTVDFIGNYAGSYTRTIGDGYFYTANNTFFSVDTNTFYEGEGFQVTSHNTNIKWNGFTKVLNNYQDYGNAPTKLKSNNDNIYYWRGDLIATIGGTKYYEVGQGTTSSSTQPVGTTTEYTTDFAGNYTRTYSNTTNYTRDFIGDYTGVYSRDFNYARDYIRGYTSTSTGTGFYASTRFYASSPPEFDEQGNIIGNERVHDGYSRLRVSSYNSDIYYTGNYSRGFAGNYAGNYTRSIDYAGNYARNFTRDLYYSRNFVRTRIATFEGNYSRTSAGNFVGNYNRTRITDYSRSRPSAYARSYTTGFVGDYARGYVGDYVANFAGNFIGNYSRNYFGNYTANFIGNYSRTFGGNYSRNFTRDRVTQGAGYFTRDFLVGNYTGNYSRGFAGEYTGNFAGNYTGDFLTPFTGNYTREFSRSIGSDYAGNYSRDFAGNYTGNYSRDYTRSFAGNYSRNFIGDYTGAYEGTYSRTSTRDRSSSYANTFGGSYQRTFVGDYTGNYIGNYTRNGTGSQEDSEIGWQGETFVAELRTGNTSSLMSEPRGSSNVRVLDSKSFTLYDNDIGTILSTTQNIVHHSATTHTVEFDFNTQGDQAVQGRIYNSGLTLLQSFTIQNANGAQTVTVSDVPAEGQTKQYTIGFYNGSQWLNSGEYTVTKVSSNATDSTPTYTANYATPPFTTTFNPNIAH